MNWLNVEKSRSTLDAETPSGDFDYLMTIEDFQERERRENDAKPSNGSIRCYQGSNLGFGNTD